MNRMDSYQMPSYFWFICVFLLSVTGHASPLDDFITDEIVLQVVDDGFKIQNGLTVGISPDSLIQYDGFSPDPLTTTSGPYGGGIVIRSLTGDAIYFPKEGVDGLKDFTFAFYIKLNGLNYHNNFISLANTINTNELVIAYNYIQDSTKGILLTVGNEIYPFPGTEAVLSDLDWHHVAVTRSDTIATVYVDGSPVGSPIFVPATRLNVVSGGYIIGQDQDVVGGGFQWDQNLHGAIGGLRVYHYAVEPDIVSQLSHKDCPAEGTSCDDNNPKTIEDQEDGQCNCLGTLEKNAKELAITKALNERQVLRNRYLISGIIILILGGLGVFSLIGHRRRLEKEELQKRNLEEKEKRLIAERELESKRKELTTKALQLVKKNEFLSSLEKEVSELKSTPDADKKLTSARISRMIEYDVANEEMWEQFSKEFNILHSDFMEKLIQEFGSFTKSQVRLIALLKMNMSSKDIMSILRISTPGLNKARYRLRKKLNLQTEENLQSFLLAYDS